MCDNPLHYKWSSYSTKPGVSNTPWLDIDPCFKALGETAGKQRIRYKAFVEDSSGTDAVDQFIQTALSRNQLTGNNRFIDEVEKRLGIRVEYRGQGRPAKVDKSIK